MDDNEHAAYGLQDKSVKAHYAKAGKNRLHAHHTTSCRAAGPYTKYAEMLGISHQDGVEQLHPN